KVINEEIDRFDFLGMDVKETADATKNILNSKDFKINFVNDILENNRENIKFSEIVGSKKDNEDHNDIFNVGNSELYYEIHMFYDFLGTEYELTLLLEGKNIKSEPTIEWGDIDATLILDDTGEDIDIDWLKTDENLYKTFIKSLIEGDFDEE
ncbi:unnamed protein product, partial [marine sediment metagenome]